MDMLDVKMLSFSSLGALILIEDVNAIECAKRI